MASAIFSVVSSAGFQLYCGAESKVVCRETLCTEGKIVTDIVENKSPEVSPKNIVSKYVTEPVQTLMVKLHVRVSGSEDEE